MRRSIVATLLLAACAGGGKGAENPANNGSASSAEGAIATLGPGAGLIFSPESGGKVTMTAEDGSTQELADGAAVTLVSDDAEAGGNPETAATIVVDGKTGTVPNARVIAEDRLKRQPDGSWALFLAIGGCGDFCYAEAWVADGTGKRVLLTTEAGPDATVAWRADGQEVAIGSRALYLVALPGLAVAKQDGITSPAYAPDGTLYVRGTDGAVYRIVDGKREVLAPGGEREIDPEEGDPGDPPAVTFGEDGKPSW